MPDAPEKVIVTGATGSVGMAIVEAFALSGARVTAQFHSDDVGAARLREVENVTTMKVDLGDGAGIDALAGVAPDILINAAGVNLTSAKVHDVSQADWRQTIEINLMAPIRLAAAVLPGMVDRRWGRIVNISSIYGVRGSKQNGPYNVSKHGLRGLTVSIALEYATFGITCNEICPGAVESKLMARIAADHEKEDGQPAEEYLEAVRQSSPNRRMASPEDVASVAVFLASERASHVNGVSLPVDGGTIA